MTDVLEIRGSVVHGTIAAPPSKSMAQRALAAAYLSSGRSKILNIGNAADTKTLIKVLQSLGTSITFDKADVIVESSLPREEKSIIHCGESGLALRLMLPIAALSEKEVTIDADQVLRNRPHDFIFPALAKLGVEVLGAKGQWPLRIKGPLQVRDCALDGSSSSQFISGLLMAYAGKNAQGVRVKINDGKSLPYLKMTADVLQHFGSKILTEVDSSFYFPTENEPLKPTSYTVPGDWSNVAFLIVAAALAAEKLEITGLNFQSSQGDKIILEVVEQAGVHFEVKSDTLVVHRSIIKPFTFDATHYPDLVPPLAVLAAHATDTCYISGVDRLVGKESNRAATLVSEFTKLGVDIRVVNHVMSIQPKEIFYKGQVKAHQDHRIAMACSLMCLRSQGAIILAGASAVNKSYPDFFTHLSAMGVLVKPIS